MKKFYKRREALLNREQEKQKKNQFLFFKERLNALKEQIDKEISKLEQTESNSQPLWQNKFLDVFGEQEPVNVLTRELIELLVERINIYDNKKIVVIFKFADEYQQACTTFEATFINFIRMVSICCFFMPLGRTMRRK